MEKIELEVYGFDILQEYFRVKGGEKNKRKLTMQQEITLHPLERCKYPSSAEEQTQMNQEEI